MSGTQPGNGSPLAYGALVLGALVWGVIWYPYRLLLEQGVGGIGASMLTYGVALLLGAIFLWRHFVALRPSPILILIALAAGACNLGYVLATVHGEVMRVLLLFYLAPLWTVLMSRMVLGERLDASGAFVIALSLAGAATMLWHTEFGVPWPRSGAEWIGLAAGFLFALTNVLVRRAAHLTIEVKSLAICIGVIVIALVLFAAGFEAAPRLSAAAGAGKIVGIIVGIGIVLLLINLVVQYGLMRVPANRAIVILLTELIFAAVSSWLLAGETMVLREWVGGGMIAAASLLSARSVPAA